MRAPRVLLREHAGKFSTGGPLLPKDVVDRIANGNPVRVLREWRDVTRMYLSFKTNLSQGHISDIENGRRVGTVAALRLIANG
jgi:hypothetical protein